MDGPAAQPSLGRGGDPHDGLAVDRGGVPETDRQHPTALRLAAGRQGRRVALAGQLAERHERGELAAGPAIDLGQLAIERRLGGDGHDEDIRGHVPRLIGDDMKLHGWGVLRERTASGPSDDRPVGWMLHAV